MFATVPDPPRPAAVECDVVATSTIAVAAADAARLREPILAAFPQRLSNALLKQADEQSLVALSAFGDLLGRHPECRAELPRWGLVAAPRMPGRRRMIESVHKYREAGAWSVSPHVIPHCTLHSLSGLMSQALGLHGPNIGTGGMQGSESEAFVVAAAWLATENLPGVWVLLTGWDREATTYAGLNCQAVLLGLRAAKLTTAGRFPRLVVTPSTASSPGASTFTLEAFRSALECGRPAAWRLGAAGTMSLQPARGTLEAAA